MEPNPYESPQHCLERAELPEPTKPIPRWVWVAYWIVIPLAILNLIYVALALVADRLAHP